MAGSSGRADAAAFDEFYAATRARLLQQLSLMTMDRELAQDALQEAYVKAWQRWSRIARLDDPEAWVRTVAYRSCISHWRRLLTARKHQGDLQTPASAREPDVAAVLDVREALAHLPQGQRVVLVLHELCDLSVEQVAAELGLPTGTVKARLSRGRSALQPLLRSTQDDGHDTRADGHVTQVPMAAGVSDD
jgi:RNA polymerase sigma-70 factor (ECF subfamily)